MNRSFPLALAAATVALLPLAIPALAHAGELDVSANTPAVSVSTRPAGRNFMRLPDLEYEFVIDASCPTGQQPGAISISIADTRVSLGAVAPTVLLVQDCADAIIGSTLDDAALDALAAAASAACNPITDKRGTVEFRTDVAGVLAKRAAKIAYARAKGETVKGAHA